jgi:hypothetical protein
VHRDDSLCGPIIIGRGVKLQRPNVNNFLINEILASNCLLLQKKKIGMFKCFIHGLIFIVL